jgi:uncharacterized caspase-like protein
MRLCRVRTRTLRALALGAGLAIAAAQAQAPIDLRVALVIGNAAYAAAPLVNPANDAKAMADALKSMGFAVIEAHDASKAQMQAALARAHDALKGRSGVGMLYYAGHGLQLDWRNYMVPVDARLASAADVAVQTLDVQAVIDSFKAAGNRMNIVVLDACRDNPFAATASGKGLAQMDAPPGTLLAYATAPGNVAEDGSAKSGNGLYTQFLVQELGRRATSIETLFKRVRLQVRMQSDGRQIPWESTSLEDDFYFDPTAKPAKASEVEETQQRRVELEAWTRIAESTNAADFSDYLLRFPDGRYAELAQFKLDQLQKPKLAPVRDRNGALAPTPGARRYLVGDVYTFNIYENFGVRKPLSVSRREVTYADDNKVLLNGGAWIFDQMGTETRDGYGGKVPGLVRAPADVAVGKKWQSDYVTVVAKAPSRHVTYDHKVVARETITVPAGSFDTYRIESRGQAVGDGGYYLRLSDLTWVDAQGLFVVKNEWRFDPRSGPPSVNLGRELAELKRVPR